MREARVWRKSSKSDGDHGCVGVPGTLDAFCDLKDPNGPELEISPAAFRAFIEGVKRGEFTNR